MKELNYEKRSTFTTKSSRSYPRRTLYPSQSPRHATPRRTRVVTLPDSARGAVRGGPPPQRAAFLTAAPQTGRTSTTRTSSASTTRGRPWRQKTCTSPTKFMRGVTLKERVRRIAPFALAVAAEWSSPSPRRWSAPARRNGAHGGLRPRQVLLSPEEQISVSSFT